MSHQIYHGKLEHWSRVYLSSKEIEDLIKTPGPACNAEFSHRGYYLSGALFSPMGGRVNHRFTAPIKRILKHHDMVETVDGELYALGTPSSIEWTFNDRSIVGRNDDGVVVTISLKFPDQNPYRADEASEFIALIATALNKR